jgi:hypothetical protein
VGEGEGFGDAGLDEGGPEAGGPAGPAGGEEAGSLDPDDGCAGTLPDVPASPGDDVSLASEALACASRTALCPWSVDVSVEPLAAPSELAEPF